MSPSFPQRRPMLLFVLIILGGLVAVYLVAFRPAQIRVAQEQQATAVTRAADEAAQVKFQSFCTRASQLPLTQRPSREPIVFWEDGDLRSGPGGSRIEAHSLGQIGSVVCLTYDENTIQKCEYGSFGGQLSTGLLQICAAEASGV